MSSKEIDLDELRTFEPDTLLYGSLVAILSSDKPEAVASLTILLEKLKANVELEPSDTVDVLLSVMDDLEELGYFDKEEEGNEEDGIEFEIRTFPDEDPKKRLN